MSQPGQLLRRLGSRLEKCLRSHKHNQITDPCLSNQDNLEELGLLPLSVLPISQIFRKGQSLGSQFGIQTTVLLFPSIMETSQYRS